MGFLNKLRSTFSKEEERVPPPPAPGHHPGEESHGQAAYTTPTFPKQNPLAPKPQKATPAPAAALDSPPAFNPQQQTPQPTQHPVSTQPPTPDPIPQSRPVQDAAPITVQEPPKQDPIPRQRPEHATPLFAPEPQQPIPQPTQSQPPEQTPTPSHVSQEPQVSASIPDMVEDTPPRTRTPWFKEESAKPSTSPKKPEPVVIKDNPAHDEPFFSQKPREDIEVTHSKLVPPVKTEPVQSHPTQTPPSRPIPDVLSDAPQESPETIARMLRDIPTPQPEPVDSEIDIEDAPTFHLHDGRVVAGPSSLAMVAQDMSDAVFSHHVTSDRNDFATWIKDGLKKPALAARVKQATSPKELFQVLSTYHGAASNTKPLPDLPSTPPQPKQPGVDVESLKQAFSEITSELEQASAMQTALDQEKTVLEERENSLLAREQAFKKSMESFERERTQTQQALSETARLRDELRRRHVELTELQLSLEAHKQRLEVAQARKPAPVSAPARALTHDVREDSFAQVANSSPQQAPHQPSADAHAVLDAVERAHKALVNNDVSQARALYSSARELFYSTHLPEGERRELYNLIRELYTDIELSRIS